MIKKLLSLCFPFFYIAFAVTAQTSDKVVHVVYLLGNTATAEIPENNYQAFSQEIQTQQHQFSIVHLGDIYENNGFLKKSKRSNANLLSRLTYFSSLNPLGSMLFVPGDKDWDNSGPNGLENIRRLEKNLRDGQTNAKLLLPQNGCPGPQVVDLTPGLRLIAINTQWWMHPHQKPVGPDTDCSILSEEEFAEELEDAIRNAGTRQVLIVGHHPVYSNGVYGGRMPLKKHLFPFSDSRAGSRLPLPVLGSLYASFRQNVGTPRDMANPRYQAFIHTVSRVLKLNQHVIYAAAHDYSLQLNKVDNNYHIISGSFAEEDFVGKNKKSLFNQASQGFSKLTYHQSGKVTSTFYGFKGNTVQELYSTTLFQSVCDPNPVAGALINETGPCLQDALAPNPPPPAPPRLDTTLVAGAQYEVGPTKQFFFGTLYRKSWITPVRVPFLYLSQTPEGLQPVKVGGGRQTTSLRLQADDGREFVFRSVDKDPIEALSPELRHTVVTDVLRDITATAQPYAALAVSSLLDSTDILHARPRLYVLGSDSTLGSFRKKFTNLFGMLEERAVDPTPTAPGFGGSDDVKGSFNFFRQLYKDHTNRVDAYALGKARAFDMLIGDFGRHPDNWRWAAYKTDTGTVYKPIPRDRDHAFSRWNGLIPWLADREWAVPSIQNFDAEFSGMRSLNWPARHLDRFLLTSLSRQDWQSIGRYLQSRLTDETIDQAIAQLPPEIIPIHGEEIASRLKTRRERLPQVLDDYYALLARTVDIVGSNKSEYFQVDRLPDKSVRVQMFRKDKNTKGPSGPALYDRTFYRKETQEIRLYGLDGKDVFAVNGTANSSILVRIIGGPGQDSVVDRSRVRGLQRFTRVYDNLGTSLSLGSEGKNKTSNQPGINYYSRQSFEYNTYSPAVSLLYNGSDGLGASVGVTYKKHHFRKPDYGSLYALKLRGTQNGHFQVTTHMQWREAIGQFDLGASADYGRFFRYYNFFGLGNQTSKDDNLHDGNFYKARFGGLMTNLYLQRTFLQKSHIRLGSLFETLQTDYREGALLDKDDLLVVNTADQRLAGANAEFNLDMRDRVLFTQKGIRLFVAHQSYKRLRAGKDWFGHTEGFADYYASFRVGLPITLALRAGGARNYGENLPFFKYTSLGLRHNLRGFVFNRFSGDASAYFNSELRFHLGQVNNSFLPFRYGLMAFYDQGRVWYQGKSEGRWHQGYGGGFYISPIAEKFTFSLMLQRSREENLLLQVGSGFRFDY